MKPWNRGKKAKKNQKVTFQCTHCGRNIPELLYVDRDVCERCSDLFEYENLLEEQRGDPDNMGKHLPRCRDLSEYMMDITFDSFWETVLEHGVDTIDKKTLSKESYIEGATSMLGLLMSVGMPPDYLDELSRAIMVAKKEREKERSKAVRNGKK